MIDTQSEPGAWEEAFARGCLTETVARCREQPDRKRHWPESYPDPVFQGVIPLDHPTTSEAR